MTGVLAVGAADRAGAGDRAGRRRGNAHISEEDRVYHCPECEEVCNDPVEMGEHIERHRPVGPPVYYLKEGMTDKLKSIPCPKGCGRHFINRPGEWEWKKGLMGEHAQNCQGATPLPVSAEEE